MTGANGFLKKNECTVVWAAFRDRNFEVGLPKAMSVPSKLQHCHSTLGHSPHICTYASKNHNFTRFLLSFPCIPLLYATYMPPISIGTSSESHRNLIG